MSTLAADPTAVAEGMTADDVRQGIADFDRGVEHSFAVSTGYDLVHEGRRYPPKAIYGLAAQRLAGRVLHPSEFSGGEGSQCFKVLRNLGFTIVPKGGGRKARIWAIGLGESGKYFRQCYDEGIIAIGWNHLGDLSQYPDKEAIAERLAAGKGASSNPFNNALSTYAFAHVMKEGDLAVAKVGRDKVLGVARVTSSYIYDPERVPYHNIRKVEWLSDQPVRLPAEARVPIKTLTDASPADHPKFAQFIAQAYDLDLGELEDAATDQESLASLRQLWSSCQARAVDQLRLRVKLERAKQLRELLADPDHITVASFNRDVWVMEHQTLMRGQDATGEIWSTDLDESRAQEFLEALEADELEFHGNMIWGTGTKVFGSRIADPDEQLANIQQALGILNDDALSPLEKANQIWGIKGFGQNSATGLVMVKHSTEFAIYNTPSEKALRDLGYQFQNLKQFQEAVAELRDELQIDDFIQLDYLLYWSLRAEPEAPRFWWVNQGHTYDVERQGGYLWAPLADRGGRTHAHHAAMAEVRPGDYVIHYANKAIRAISHVTAEAQEAPRPVERTGEPPDTPGRLLHTDYAELDEAIPLDDVPSDWRQTAGGPFDRFGDVKQGYLFELGEDFVGRLAGRFPDRLTALPVEAAAGQRTWLFQANPKLWSFSEHLEELRHIESDSWTVTRYADSIQVGDRALIWESGSDAGLVAVAEVIAKPALAPVPTDLREVRGGSTDEMRVQIRYKHFIEPKLGKAEIADHPVLSKMQVFRAPQGTNFHVTEAEWAALEKILDDRVLQSVEDYKEPDFEAITHAIGRSGLRIDPIILRRYHLSLKTRGFLILTGVSGTGKTRLAEEYARAVGAERCVVPVAPNWNSNEDLLGFFNPLDERYAHTEFSRFLQRAEQAYRQAYEAGVTPRPYHLILDEMNLARVEHYFAKFLSAMERRRGNSLPSIDLGGDYTVTLPPNLKFIGTVNMDETTHGFADKVYDRAQTIEMTIDEERLTDHLADAPYAGLLLKVWRVAHPVAPFAFRIVDEIAAYVEQAEAIDLGWQEALDDQILQKILPKFNGADAAVGHALGQLVDMLAEQCPQSYNKAQHMHEGFQNHGFVSYF